MDIKDEEIKRLSDIAAGKEDYSTWWAVGGVVVGIGITLAVVFAVDAVECQWLANVKET